VAVLVLVVILASLGAAVIAQGSSHSIRVELNEDSIQDLALCELGVGRATYEIGRGEDTDEEEGVGNVRFTRGQEEVLVRANPLARRHVRLLARATSPGSSRAIEVTLHATPTTVFSQALAGQDDVTVGGGFVTDSYDSDEGSYLSQLVNADENGSYANAFGSVSSNGTLSVEGSSTSIRGSASAGPGQELTTTGSPSITGSTESLSQPLDFPFPPIEEFMEALLDNRNGTWAPTAGVSYNPVTYSLSVAAHTTLSLPPGTYFFTSLSIAGHSRLEIQGETRIYLTGGLNATGGTITNLTERARDLAIIAHPYRIPVTHVPPDPMVLSLSGSASTALTVYAPACDVNIAGGSDLFGAVVGRTIDARGAMFHYDESLGYEEGIDFQPHAQVAWREVGRPVE